MPNDVSKRTDAPPAPYGYRDDGVPMTALEASAKQMDDWAARHGFSGTVRMGIGAQDGEPKEWRGVKIIGSDKALQQNPAPVIEREVIKPLLEPEPEQLWDYPPPLLEVKNYSPPPPKPSLLGRLLNWFKGAR
jgi:hypothetical protein